MQIERNFCLIHLLFLISCVVAFSPEWYYNEYHYDCGAVQANLTDQYFCQTQYTYGFIRNETAIQSVYFKDVSYMPLNVSLDNAIMIYNDLVQDNEVSDACRSYITDFACEIAMPYCSNGYSSSIPWTVCQSECIYLKKLCPFINVDCNDFQSDPALCFRNEEILQMQEGYRWLWPLHIALSIYYLGLLIFWHIMAAKLFHQCNSLQSAYTPSLYIKLIACIFTAVEWWEIDHTEGLNTNTWSIVMICGNLLFQTYFIADLLMFSKGWCIITSNYIRDDWIHTYIMALLYYIVVCIVNLSSIDIYNLILYHIYCMIITTLIFVHVAYNIYDSFQDCYQKMYVLNQDGLSPYKSPAYAKYMVFQWLSLFVGIQYLCLLVRHIAIPIIETYTDSDTIVFYDILISEIPFALLMTFFTVVFYPRTDCVLYTNLLGEDEDELSTMPSMKSLKEYQSRYFNRLGKVSEIAVILPDSTIYIGKRYIDKREVYHTPSPVEEDEEEQEGSEHGNEISPRSNPDHESFHSVESPHEQDPRESQMNQEEHFEPVLKDQTQETTSELNRVDPSTHPSEQTNSIPNEHNSEPNTFNNENNSDSDDSYVPKQYVIQN